MPFERIKNVGGKNPTPKILPLLEFWFLGKEMTTIQAFKTNLILKKINLEQRWAVFLGFFCPFLS